MACLYLTQCGCDAARSAIRLTLCNRVLQAEGWVRAKCRQAMQQLQANLNEAGKRQYLGQ
jgi:hypothetical protein